MTDEPREVVRRLLTSMQARDWDAAASVLADDVDVVWPATGERFVGASFLAMQRAYPEGWTITVEDVLADGAQVAARVRVEQDGVAYCCAGFYEVRDGLVVRAVEHWVTEDGERPPAWRARYAETDVHTEWRDLFRLELGTPGPVRRELVALVVAGRKTATAGLMDEYLADPDGFGPLPVPGLRMLLVDDDGRPAGVVTDVRAETHRFADVPDEFALAEGEGMTDAAAWREQHRRYWEANVAPVLRSSLDPAWELTDDTLVVCEWFRFDPLPD